MPNPDLGNKRGEVRNPDLDIELLRKRCVTRTYQVRVRHRAQVRNPVFTPLSPG